MTKQDIVNNKRYFAIIITYGIVLGVIYSFWMYKSDLPVWSYILVGAAFVIGSIAWSFIYFNIKNKKNNNSDENDKIEEN